MGLCRWRRQSHHAATPAATSVHKQMYTCEGETECEARAPRSLIQTERHRFTGRHADLHAVVIKLSIFLRVKAVTQESRTEMMM